MRTPWLRWIIFVVVCTIVHRTSTAVHAGEGQGDAVLILKSRALAPLQNESSRKRALRIDGMFLETAQGSVSLPASLVAGYEKGVLERQVPMSDGRLVRLVVRPDGLNFLLSFSAQPSQDIQKWGFSIDAGKQEFYTGLMERVVDGPQRESWMPGLKEAMNLRGQKVEMILKPSTSVYAPFFLSSRGYGVFVKGTWPGRYDFCVSDPTRVKIEFEGPSIELRIYTAEQPVEIVKAHARDAGLPLLPPKWVFQPMRWRDELKQHTKYYDGTPVTGPFNAEVMEDVLLMKAYGIPCGAYWINRRWGKGSNGYDDFKIDENRLPLFPEMVKWLNGEQIHTLIWIAPFFQGEMERQALKNGYNLAGQSPQGEDYPAVDFTNPSAKAYWQGGLSKLLEQGVAGFKLDRTDEDPIPSEGPFTTFDGRSIRENRNAYPGMAMDAANEQARKHRGDDFALIARSAYTGTAQNSIVWGGDVWGTPEGLRASIVAVQRSAVIGYPLWGSDTGGKNRATLEKELCARWLAFSCFTPIMEVGPTNNLCFWSLPRGYDADLIAIWRFYARLHQQLADYTHKCSIEAHETGMPIVRPLFLIDAKSPQAWENWQAYLYGPDLLVSPVWETNRTSQEVFLPNGSKWRDAWQPHQIYPGGKTITVQVALHQIPLFIRVGSMIELGDLEAKYQEAQTAAIQRPNLGVLDRFLKAKFDRETHAK